MEKRIKVEKDYYFSYENVRQKLREARRLWGIEHFKGVTVLDMLAKLLHAEAIGIDAYGEVEWRAFGITADNIEKIAKIIEKPDEIVRVFTYISDHAYDVLPLDATQEEIEAFELACDSLVCKVIDENKPPVKGGYDENRPYLRLIGANYRMQGEVEKRSNIIFKHMWKPSDYQYTNLFPVDSIYFAAKSTMFLATILYPVPKEEDDEQVEMPDIEKLLPNIRVSLSMMANRPVRDHKEPMIQTLFVMSVYAKEAAGPESPTTRYMMKFSNILIDYISKKYDVDVSESVREAAIEIRDYMMSTITESINKRVEQDIALGEINPIEDDDTDEDDVKDEDIQNDKPDSSFFTCSKDYPYETCKKQLIQDINTATSKLNACRNIRRSTSAGYFQLQGKTNEEKAKLINPWVAYTTKDYVFTKDDFRKAPNVKRKQ